MNEEKNRLLEAENIVLRNELQRILSMLRVTLGVAIQARPDIPHFRAMFNSLYIMESSDESGQS